MKAAMSTTLKKDLSQTTCSGEHARQLQRQLAQLAEKVGVITIDCPHCRTKRTYRITDVTSR